LKAISAKTLGEMEAAVSQAMIRFEKEFMGRGPLETKTLILDADAGGDDAGGGQRP
jgi:uncharacterized protein YbcI